MRASGILLPVFSLPGSFGAGSFSKEAFEFIDYLQKCGQKYWQILPLGPTGYGDSPYQAYSTFAGNPFFISVEKLAEQGLITPEELENQKCPSNDEYADYEMLAEKRWPILRKAYDRFEKTAQFKEYCSENETWLDDYAAFRVLKDKNEGKCWQEWPEEYKGRDKTAMAALLAESSKEIGFYKFVEFEFYTQWMNVKDYANARGISIIGDLPIYVSFDSSDAWSKPEIFEYDSELRPKNVAGCPPDAFSADGQLWGNPVYDWEYQKKDGYSWWIKRLKYCFTMYDVVRLDHFRGFAGYYNVPYGDSNARNGFWKKGPGKGFFDEVKKKLGNVKIIAEDLGFLTDDVFELKAETGYPGMKILEFAFDETHDSIYLPYKYDKNCVVYTGTHDNNTVVGWLESIDVKEMDFIKGYLGKPYADINDITWSLIRLAHSSCADLCIIPIQDYLCLGSEARINEPSTVGNNWKWRMKREWQSEELAQSIYNMTTMYGR